MSILRKRLYYIWKKTSEIQFRKRFGLDNYKNDIERFKNCTVTKPAAQIKSEMKALQKHWDCYPYQYYRFDMYRQDCTLSLEEMKKYVPYFFMHRLFFPNSFKDYGIITDDKNLTYALLNTYAVPQPKMMFGFEDKTFYDITNSPVSETIIDGIINSSVADKLFIKPRFGLGGKGIVVFNKKGHRFVNAQDRELDHSFFLDELKGNFYIIQEGLAQHHEMNNIYPHSINTFRIITECSEGKINVMYSLLRMGRGGKQIDNASSGGMYLKIDADTGILADYASDHSHNTYDAHPDTGFVFKDAKLNCWAEARAFVLHVAEKFRTIKYLGWDIGFSENGPVVIEINKRPDIGLIQDYYGGMRDDFKIEPKKWWYRSNYTIKDL